MKGRGKKDHDRRAKPSRKPSSVPHTCLQRVQAVKVCAIRPSADSCDHGELFGDDLRGFANLCSGVTGVILH